MMNSLDMTTYEAALEQVNLFTKYGPFGVKIQGQKFIRCSWKNSIQAYVSSAVAPLFRKSSHFNNSIQLLTQNVRVINQIHTRLSNPSSDPVAYSRALQVTKIWNQQFNTTSLRCLQRLARLIQSWIGLNWQSKYADQLRIKPIQIIANCPLFSNEQFSCYYLNPQKMPLVVSPNIREISLASFQEWAVRHRSELKALVADQGAILLRNFPVSNAADFASTLRSILGQELIDYLGGEGSRKTVIRGVYTSTEAPPSFTIPLHNELSCTENAVTYICFYCDTAPSSGSGQTLLGRTREITEALQKNLRVWNFFKDKKIQYISRHPPEGSLFNRINKTHKTWHSSFATSDKKEVDRICKEKNFKHRWIGNWVEVIRHAPAFKVKDDGEVYWFNQAYLYHANPRGRGGWINHILASLLYAHPKTRQYDVKLADGTSIPRSIMYDVYNVLEQSTIKFDWQKEDVLIMNNVEALHGRASYVGPRRILTAMVQ